MRKWRILLALSILVIFVELAYLSVARYRGYNVAMLDLGNMTQAIWSATQGKPLVFTYTHGPYSRLALHVELSYFLVALPYALFPSPITLLLIQSLLFVLGAVPLYRLAERRLENGFAAVAIAWIYLLYPVAQTAALFDFHGDTLAMPLLLFALEALDRRAWRLYALWIVLALCCKFYVAVPVGALGVIVYLQGNRRAGIATSVVAVAWGLIVYGVIRPLFAPPQVSGLQQATAGGYFTFYFGDLLSSLGSSWPDRVSNAAIVFLPVLWPIMYAKLWLLPALAIGLPALLSTGPGPSYGYSYHHYALVVPFAVTGTVYGIAALRERRTSWRASTGPFLAWPFLLQLTLILTFTFNSFFVDAARSLEFWRKGGGALSDPLRYARTSRDSVKDSWLVENVPPHAPTAASTVLAPHLANRETLFVIASLREYSDQVDYVVVDALLDFIQVPNPTTFKGGAAQEWSEIGWLLQRADFRLISARDGLLLFARADDRTDDLALTVHQVKDPRPSPPLHTFSDEIGLISYHVEHLSERVLSLTWCWAPLRPLEEVVGRFAVSRLDGVLDERFVHLPTSTLMPTSTWRPGHRVCETFDVTVTQDVPAGDYPLMVGWYDASDRYAFATDERSRVGEEVRVGVISLP
jgi:uncharacterized membrane protein